MASITAASITLGSVVSGKRDVTVTPTLAFDAGDVGKSYRLEIKVYGEDKTGDKLPSGDAVGDDLLYTYSWPGPFLSRPYKSITVAAAGTLTLTETRSLDATKLDEDSGTEIIGWADINTPILMPRKDEVYANVTLSGAPTSVKTATVTAGFGV